MGGRGGSSGLGESRTSGLDVTIGGETTRYYFTNHGGKNFYQRGAGAMPEETPLNMSKSEFKKRVERNGAVTKNVSNSTYKKEEAEYNKQRANRPDYELGVGLKDNSTYRKTARRSRLMTRAMKKKR